MSENLHATYRFWITKGSAMYSGDGWGFEDFRGRLRAMAGEKRLIKAIATFADGTELEIHVREDTDG